MNNSERRNVYIIVALSCAILLGLFSQSGFFDEVTAQGSNKNYAEKSAVFQDVLFYVRDYYVDEDALTPEKLIYGAVDGMLATLDDPYSRLMKPKQYDDMKTETSQEFGGLGIFITIKDGVLTVIAPIEGTPAFEAGLLPGDKIVGINGNSTKEIKKTSEAVDILRGPKGTDVTITIQRWDENFDVTITRDEIPIKSVFYSIVDPEYKIGYIKITNFGEKTHTEIRDALKDLHGQGMKALVLDLRNNPGGLLQSAYHVANKWIKNKLIVYTNGRVSSQNKQYPSTIRNTEGQYPMTVITNGGSASGSEIVAGALKDHERALLVGDTTFGKGLVQSVYPLDDGAALALTTARYYTPDGHMIQDKGIPPHISVKQEAPDSTVRKQLVKLARGDTVLNFVKKHPDPSPEQLNIFIQSLRDEGITIERRYLLNRIRRQQYAMEGKAVAADPSIDPQLSKTLQLFRETLDMSPWTVAKIIHGQK